MSYAEVAILSPYLASLRAVNRSSSKLHCMLLIYSSNCFPLTPLTCDGPWRVYNTGSSLLSHLVTNRRLRLFGHIAPSLSREDHHRALAACIRQVPPDWKRAAGRPSHTWLHAIEADLGPWPHDCLEKGHYSRRMATYCGHRNAPAEYALKET